MSEQQQQGLMVDQMMTDAANLKLFRAAGFPHRLKKCDVQAPRFGTSSAAITAWQGKFRMMQQAVGHDGVTFALVGIRGCGKSQLGVELGRSMTSKGMGARYVRAAWLFVNIRSTYQPGAKVTEEEAILEWLKPRLLVIDELDKRKETEAEDLLIENIVCQRHDDGKDTVLISNLKKKELLESVGESIQSRMCEGGGVVECGWESFRGGN